jgi:hypothetical protein
LIAACVTACCWLSPAASSAQSAFPDNLDLPVDVHAFASQGVLLSTRNNYLAKSKRVSFEFTEVGLNVSKQLTDRLRVGMQLFAHDLGPSGNYQAHFDWFFLDYRFWDWFGLRAGRTKIPFGLYNEANDVDQARVPILLPQSVYPIDNRDYLLAVTGGELYGDISLGGAGELEYRAYGGTIYIDTSKPPNPNVTISDFSVPYVLGGRLMWLTPIPGLQAGASFQALRLDTTYQLVPAATMGLVAAGLAPADFDGAVGVKIPLKLWVASIEYTAHDLLLAAEYGRWAGDVQSAVPLVFPNSKTLNERFYGMVAYHVTPWLTPGMYYSGFYLNVKDRKGKDAYQHDVAATLRFDLTPNWLVKVEGHFMHGTAALNSNLNDGKPLSELKKDWFLFLLKTTAYF